MKSKFKVLISLALIITILSTSTGTDPEIAKTSASEEEFTIIVLPDTQKYSQSYPDVYSSQTQWIVDNKDSLNIIFVLHEGDIVQNWNAITEYDNANSSMSLLDNNVPYSVIPGNHDHEGGSTTGSTSHYNTYFPTSRFDSNSWWGGSYNDNDNNYQLITIGELEYIFLSLDYCPSLDEITWADNILNTYQDRKAILTTHRYLDSNGNRNECGENIWTNLINTHSNLQIILCGHVHTEARRTDINQAGKPVHQMLADYQDRNNGGNGWLRILTFTPSENRIYVKTYSPYLNQYETDPSSEFTLDYEMTNNFHPYPLCNITSDIVDSNENTVYFIYPDHEGIKPAGVNPAMLSDWTATGYIIGMCSNRQNEATDTDPLIIELNSGFINLNNKTIVLFGGPLVNSPVHYYETNRIAPTYWRNIGGTFYWYAANGTRLEATAMAYSEITTGNDMFVVEAFTDNSGNEIFIVYGYGWKGTFAGGKFFKFIMYPNISHYTGSYYVFKWEDTNGNGFADLSEIILTPIVSDA